MPLALAFAFVPWLGLGLATANVVAAPQEPVLVRGAAELRTALAAARPGTTIAVAPGDYAAVTAANVRGEDGRPVTIRAADLARPPRFTAGVHLSDAEHVVLEDLAFEGAPAN